MPTTFNVALEETPLGDLWKFETNIGDFYYFRGLFVKQQFYGDVVPVTDVKLCGYLHDVMETAK